MKRNLILIVFALLLTNGGLFAEIKNDDVERRLDELDQLFEEEKKEDEELEKSKQEMLKELEKLMREAEKNMNEKIAPMLGKKKTGEKVRGIQDETLGDLGKMVKLIKKMQQQQQQQESKSKSKKKGKKKKKKQPGKGKKKGKGKKPGPGTGGSAPNPNDDMTSGSVKGGDRSELENRNTGKNAFGKLPAKERDVMESSEGTKMGAKYAKQLRQFFDDDDEK